MIWDPDFLQRSPMLAPLGAHCASLRAFRDWPSCAALQELVAARRITNARGILLRVVAPAAHAHESYEARIYEHGELEVREREWHDVFNVLAWLAYPQAKAALNERHCSASIADQQTAEGAAASFPSGRANRGRVRDALTVFDESGAIVASSDPGLIDDLRAFRWKRLFWRQRERGLEAMGFHVFGHALFEKALRPYVGMTAHAMPVVVSADLIGEPLHLQIEHLDALIASRIRDSTELASPQALAPLPLLGVPGWWPGNAQEAFYEDARYFKAGRAKRAT